MTDGYKVCPRCEEEYTLAVTTCAGCGVALVMPDALAPRGEPEAFPDVDALACLRVGPLPWTRALSEALSERGIEHRVERDTRSDAEGGADGQRFGGEILYGTWVRPDDVGAAADIDRRLFAYFEPENAPEIGAGDACPACEAPLPADALECPGCGLAFG